MSRPNNKVRYGQEDLHHVIDSCKDGVHPIQLNNIMCIHYMILSTLCNGYCPRF